MDTSAYAAGTYAEGGSTSGLLFKFTPPTVDDIPNYGPDTHPLKIRLYRHYKPKTRGVNVYVLSDGTAVQDTPTSENQNTSYPLPWILNDPSGPFAYITNWDGSVTTDSLPVWIVYVYYGGHTEIINQTEADFLSSQGYSDCITPL